MAKEPFDQDLDALLQDLHHMLGDAPPAPPEDGLEDLDLSHLDLETPTAPIAASDVEIDYARFYDEPMPEPDPEPEPPPKPSKPEKPKYWTQTQRLPKHVAKLAQNQEQAYADWLYEQGHREETPDAHHRSLRHWPEDQEGEEAVPVKKKHHILRTLVILLLLLALLAAAVVAFVLPRQP